MISVLFICHGNICRSTMAEFVMRDMVDKAGLSDRIFVDSAAISTDELGNDTYPGTKRVLDEHGIPYSPRRAKLTTASDYDKFDYIIGMDRENMRGMQHIYKSDPDGKISLLLQWTGRDRNVADPWYTRDFETTYKDVCAGCSALLDELEKIAGSEKLEN